MEVVKVKTQAELDAALKTALNGAEIWCVGDGGFEVFGKVTVHARGSSTVHARESSTVHALESSTVHARESSTVHAWGSSTVHAWESSTVHALGSSTVHALESSTVHARGSSTVHALGSSTVHAASKYNAIVVYDKAKASGGTIIRPPAIKTASAWCKWYGVTVTRGVAVLYKGLNDNYATSRGFAYVPGTTPEAPNWDGGKAECGGGLHFSPTPGHTLEFESGAKRWVACPVRVKDIVVHYPAQYPAKVKAPRCCRPVVECDFNGKIVKVKP